MYFTKEILKISNKIWSFAKRQSSTLLIKKQISILITYKSVPNKALDVLRKEKFKLIINEESPYPTRNQIISKIHGVDALFWSSKHKLDKEIIDAAGPKLRVVGTMSAGVNHIDVELLKSRNIKLGNTPNVLNDSVAEVAVLLALAASKRLQEGRKSIENGTWKFGVQQVLGLELRKSTIGIIGFGGTGQTIAKLLQSFKIAEFLYTDHQEKPADHFFYADNVPINQLLTRSDFVFVCLPLTDKTVNMFDRKAFNLMKKTAIFINVSRGEIVNQEDLINASRGNRIFAAGLDVMTPEPLPIDHELLKLDNCILVPHIGSATYQTRVDMAMLTVQNIINGLRDEQLPCPVF